MGKSLNDILKKISLSLDKFEKICDKFTNKKIFECDSVGKLIKDRKKELTKKIYDN